MSKRKRKWMNKSQRLKMPSAFLRTRGVLYLDTAGSSLEMEAEAKACQAREARLARIHGIGPGELALIRDEAEDPELVRAANALGAKLSSRNPAYRHAYV